MYENNGGRLQRDGLGIVFAPVATVVAKTAVQAPGKILKAIGSAFKTPSHVKAIGIAANLARKALAGDQAAYTELERLTRQAATVRARAVYKRALDGVNAARQGARAAVEAAAPTIFTAATAGAAEDVATVARKAFPVILPLALLVLSQVGGRRR